MFAVMVRVSHNDWQCSPREIVCGWIHSTHNDERPQDCSLETLRASLCRGKSEPLSFSGQTLLTLIKCEKHKSVILTWCNLTSPTDLFWCSPSILHFTWQIPSVCSRVRTKQKDSKLFSLFFPGAILPNANATLDARGRWAFSVCLRFYFLRHLFLQMLDIHE